MIEKLRKLHLATKKRILYNICYYFPGNKVLSVYGYIVTKGKLVHNRTGIVCSNVYNEKKMKQ